MLTRAGLTADSIPEAGRVVYLRSTANLSTGGTATDVTDVIHPDNRDMAVRAIRAVRRRELLRVAAGDALGLTDVAEVGAALSRITDATLEATLQVVLASVAHAKNLETAAMPNEDRIATAALSVLG